jgi:hypothetical protein
VIGPARLPEGDPPDRIVGRREQGVDPLVEASRTARRQVAPATVQATGATPGPMAGLKFDGDGDGVVPHVEPPVEGA